MNEEDKKVKLETTILNPGLAKPIKISSKDAEDIALKQQEESAMVEVEHTVDRVATPTKITKEELDEQKINELNDLMKNDYVRIVDVHHSKKTYIILFLVLFIIILIIVAEVIYFGGKV